MTEVDPFTPRPPGKGELGRLVTHGTVEAGWQCRGCSNLLSRTDAGAVICLNCDPLEMPADV